MIKEFSFIGKNRKMPIKEKVKALYELVEKMMNLIVLLPDLVDKPILVINNRLINIEAKINRLESNLVQKPNKTPQIIEKPKVTFKQNNTNLRGNIMNELKILFNKRGKCE
jgi:hypothetical protein